jgi:hypothetical protein
MSTPLFSTVDVKNLWQTLLLFEKRPQELQKNDIVALMQLDKDLSEVAREILKQNSLIHSQKERLRYKDFIKIRDSEYAKLEQLIGKFFKKISDIQPKTKIISPPTTRTHTQENQLIHALSALFPPQKNEKGKEISHPLVQDTIQLFLNLSAKNIDELLKKNSLKTLFSQVEKAEEFILNIQKEIKKIKTDQLDAPSAKLSIERLQGLSFLLDLAGKSVTTLKEKISESLHEVSILSLIGELFFNRPPKTLSREEKELLIKAQNIAISRTKLMQMVRNKALICANFSSLNLQKKPDNPLSSFLEKLERLDVLKLAGCKKAEFAKWLETLFHLDTKIDLRPEELQKNLFEIELLLRHLCLAHTNIQKTTCETIVTVADLQNKLLLLQSLDALIGNVLKISREIHEKLQDKLCDHDSITFLYNIFSSVFSKKQEQKKLSKEDENTYHLTQKIANLAQFIKTQNQITQDALKNRMYFPKMKMALPHVEIRFK